MVYNWDGKEAECYRLYVQEKKSLKDVVEYWEQRGFTPSKRAFQTQFKRWGFPGKQNPAYKNPALIARVQELWEKNATQKEMLDVVQAEGFQINDRELTRLRTRFKLFLRENKSKSGQSEGSQDGAARKKGKKAKGPKLVPGNDVIDQLAAAILQEASSSEEDESEEELSGQEHPEEDVPANQWNPTVPSGSLDPAEALRRQLRQQQLQAESDEKWRARKRRRRTRGWAGLPADAPGEPPRFPSETTLDESKAYLGLDNKLYSQIREQFQLICREQNVLKKTVAGPEKWAELLRRLIRENQHLSAVFEQHVEAFQQIDALWKPKNYKALSLDVICQDVTKRMRMMETRMSIPEAKNTLKLNPKQTRDVRNAFHMILKADHFTNKFEVGDQHWNELKQRWINGSELLKHAINSSVPEPDCTQRLRAIEVMARDVKKRFGAENTRLEKEESGQANKPAHCGPGPGPAPASSTALHASSQLRASRNNAKTTISSGANTSANSSSQGAFLGRHANLSDAPDADPQIDPSLLLAASDAAVLPIPLEVPTPASLTQHQPQQLPTGSHPNAPHSSFSTQTHMHTMDSFLHPHRAAAPLPIYFRLHPRSATAFPHKTVWLSVLQGGGGVEEVKRLAAREHPGSVIVRLEGVIGTREGGEVVVSIDDDAELRAYLGHLGVGTGGDTGKVTFVVLLGGAGRGVYG